jgi:hypothetical protein
MRVVVYGKPRQRECAAVAEGFRAFGAAVSWCAPKGWTEAEADPSVDMVVTFGQRVHSGRIAKEYRRLGVPVLTVDLPPIRVQGMDETYRALWLNYVNWMPPGQHEPDRLQLFNLEFRPLNWGRVVLLCGQTENDAAHGLGPVELRKWANDQAEAIGDWYRVTWRPHPRCAFHLDGWPAATLDEPVEDVLRRGWHACVTYNSTVGLTALLNGVPVFCDPSSFYAELCSTSLARLTEPRWPSIGERVAFFSRLAYVQWTFDELADGTALDFVLQYANKR